MLIALVVVGGLFGSILFMFGAGRRLALRYKAISPEESSVGISAIDGAVFALMGLLIAFTFSGAAARFDSRRQLIVQETNDIGTAWLRLSLLQAEAQSALREDFRSYLDARISVYQKLPNFAAALRELDRANAIQKQIWSKAVVAAQASPQATMLLLPALNSMFDTATTRTAAAELHPPIVIYLLLITLLMLSALIAGYGMTGSKPPNRIHTLSYAFVMALAVYVIVDLEYPRLGLIRLEAADHFLVELRASMN